MMKNSFTISCAGDEKLAREVHEFLSSYSGRIVMEKGQIRFDSDLSAENLGNALFIFLRSGSTYAEHAVTRIDSIFTVGAPPGSDAIVPRMYSYCSFSCSSEGELILHERAHL